MRRCPLSYQEVEGRYDLAALHRLNPKLEDLEDLPYTADELRQEARERVDRLSIQGVQPKLSARLNVPQQAFELVDQGGRYIFKPQHPDYMALPENEDLTMRLAQLAGIEVPLHGLLYGRDGQLSYWIRRFDRVGREQKLSMEDFAQLLEGTRETKYKSSMEKVAGVLRKHATFPQVEAVKLLSRVLFSFLVGNEDCHLKNWSLLLEKGLVKLSPAYDLVNSFILLRSPVEIALPIRGKQRNLKSSDLLDYYAEERLELPKPVVEKVLQELAQGVVYWPEWVARSFLPDPLKESYQKLIYERVARLGLGLWELQQEDLEVLSRASLPRGQGGHQTYFRQINRQLSEHLLCLTPRQMETAQDRAIGSGGWQDAYRRLQFLGTQAQATERRTLAPTPTTTFEALVRGEEGFGKVMSAAQEAGMIVEGM